MKNFDNWLCDLSDDLKSKESISESNQEKDLTIPDCLIGCEDENAEGGYSYPCRVCGEESDIICNPEGFDERFHYCGKSPRCCP